MRSWSLGHIRLISYVGVVVNDEPSAQQYKWSYEKYNLCNTY